MLHKSTSDFKIKRGILQGNVISPKLLTVLLEYTFKQSNIEHFGITAGHIEEAKKSKRHLSQPVNLNVFTDMTKFMTNEVISENMLVQNTAIEQVYSFTYLGQKRCLGIENRLPAVEITRRIGLTWAAFGRLCHGKKSDIPVCLKRNVFNKCTRSVLTYRVETVTLTESSIQKTHVAQRATKRSRFNLSQRDKVRNTEIRKRTGAADAIERIATIK